MLGLFHRAGGEAKDRVQRARSKGRRDQGDDADQFCVMPESLALIGKEPRQQHQAHDYAQDAIHSAYIVLEHLRLRFRSEVSLS